MRAIQRLALLSLLLTSLSVAGAAVAANPGRHRGKPRAAHRRVRHHVVKVHAATQPALPPFRFGVYPWGGAGAVNHVAPARPDDPAAALSAVKHLQGSRPFVVHLYGQYTGADSGEADHLLSDARWWSENGVQVEMVLRYRPASTRVAGDYVPWVSQVSTSLAAIPGVVAIQVGNEGNNSGAPAASDGAYPGATAAIAHGVIAARAAVVSAGRPDVRIGFNWAADKNPCRSDPFFAALRQAGGASFSAAVSWVGLDVYPGTWSGTASDDPASSDIDTTVSDSVRCLRTKGMPGAGLSNATSITIAETGYPTDAQRSEGTQAQVLREVVGSVQRLARTYGVTDLRWFSLRDANTGSGQLENGYGLLHDDYSAKPAFGAYAELIARYGV